jgi:hypothetical protein
MPMMDAEGMRATFIVHRSRPQALARRGVELPPQPADAPHPEPALDGCPGRDLVGLQRPGLSPSGLVYRLVYRAQG